MITKYLNNMKGEIVVIVNGGTILYQGKAELTPYWLTETVVTHASVAGEAIRLDVVLLKEDRVNGESI